MGQENKYLTGKKVLVTGGTGFIGKHLVEKLESLGVDITVLVNIRKYNGKSIKGDISEWEDGWVSGIKSLNPDIVFHLAAQPIIGIAANNEYDTLQTNVRGTYNLLSVIKNLNVKSFVHISTDKVYGNINPIKDDSIPVGVEHPYNASKLASDSLAQMYSVFYGVPMIILRHANVYGAGDLHFDRIIPNVIARVLKEARPVIRGDGKTTRDYIHVNDIVEGYLKAAEVPFNSKKLEILNLGGFNHSALNVVDTILEKMRRVDLSPAYEELWAGEIPEQHIVNQKSKEMIGWNPKIDLEYGLDLTIPWYMQRINFVDTRKK